MGNSELVSVVVALVSAMTQLGVALAAWKLANAIKTRVDDHEIRISKLEA